MFFPFQIFSEGEAGIPTGKLLERKHIFIYINQRCNYLTRYVSVCNELYKLLVLVMIELQGKVKTDGISWMLIGTDCKSIPNLSVTANRLYKKNCGLSIGQSYTLKCEGGVAGWRSNYLVIENSKYCENTQSETKINITITGKWLYLIIM